MTKPVALKRTRQLTHVERGDKYLGYVKRQEVSNPSPRGGAYRTQHVAWYSAGTRERIGAYDTRADAVAAIVARAER